MGEAKLITGTSMFKPEEIRAPPTLLGGWKGKKPTPQSPVLVKSVPTKTPSSRPPQRPAQQRTTSNSPKRHNGPVSAVSTSPSSSPSKSLPSGTIAEASDARLTQKKLPSVSPPAKPLNLSHGASVPVEMLENAKDASRLPSLKRESPSGDASLLAEGPKANERRDASLSPSPPKRVKRLEDASMRESIVASPAPAETSRAPSPAPPVDASAPAKKASCELEGSAEPSAPSEATVESVPTLERAEMSPSSPARPPTSPILASSPIVKHNAPVSSASTSSSLTSLSSDTSVDAADADVFEEELPNTSSFAEPTIKVEDAATPVSSPENAENAFERSPLKRERQLDDMSSLAEAPEENESEYASVTPSPPKRVKRIKETSTRESSVTPTLSTETSRASTPAPTVKPSKRTKKTSRKSDGSGITKRRRKKRALTDLTLPPKKGTYRGRLDPVLVRSVTTPDSTTAYESDTNAPLHDPRQTWTEEDGDVGDKLRTSEQVVKRLSEMGRYITLFRNPHDPEDKSFELSGYPTVELEYPNTGAVETFLLARPKDEDHYDPTFDIENTLTAFIKDVIPVEYKDIFGPLPEDAIKNIVDDDDEDDKCRGSSVPVESSPSRCASISAFQTELPSPFNGIAYPDSESGTPPPTPSRRSSPSPGKLMRTLASARLRKDGPRYTATLREINRCIRELKEHISGNILRDVPRNWETGGIPVGVVHRIIEETYQRCVGPQISRLRKYEAFSSSVYGELTPAFVDDIIERTRLNSKSLFLDLGSGVGNVVLQVALRTRCKAFGIEQREDAAQIADDQLEQIKLRCRMWGVSMGDVELVQGDMITSDRVIRLMSEADVVLVNNYVFTEELNAALRPKFLDLKEGACVVSLKPFATPKSHLLTARNFDEFSAIFDVQAVPYRTGTVSWSSGSGMYYIHRVNREKYREFSERFCRNRKEAEERRKARKRRRAESEMTDSA